jgi:hypothetical protein
MLERCDICVNCFVVPHHRLARDRQIDRSLKSIQHPMIMITIKLALSWCIISQYVMLGKVIACRNYHFPTMEE